MFWGLYAIQKNYSLDYPNFMFSSVSNGFNQYQAMTSIVGNASAIFYYSFGFTFIN